MAVNEIHYRLGRTCFHSEIYRVLNNPTERDIVFTGSNGWLEESKATYGSRETRIFGEVDDVSVEIVKTRETV